MFVNNNSTISLRIPKSMASDLRKIMEKEHYVDLSEVVRYIIRLKWSEDMKSRKESTIMLEKKMLEKKHAFNDCKDGELKIAELLKNKELIKKLLMEN